MCPGLPWLGLVALARRGSRQLDRGMVGAALGLAESDLLLVVLRLLDVDHNCVAGLELLPQDLLGQRVLDEALERTTQGPGAERRVVTLRAEQVLGRIG